MVIRIVRMKIKSRANFLRVHGDAMMVIVRVVIRMVRERGVSTACLIMSVMLGNCQSFT